MNRPTDEQLARCPRAVRDYVVSLERRNSAIERLSEEMTKGGGNPHFGYTDVRREFNEPAIMLPKYANLMAFPHDRSRTLRISEQYGKLEVASLAVTLIVRPSSGNVVTLEAER